MPRGGLGNQRSLLSWLVASREGELLPSDLLSHEVIQRQETRSRQRRRGAPGDPRPAWVRRPEQRMRTQPPAEPSAALTASTPDLTRAAGQVGPAA